MGHPSGIKEPWLGCIEDPPHNYTPVVKAEDIYKADPDKLLPVTTYAELEKHVKESINWPNAAGAWSFIGQNIRGYHEHAPRFERPDCHCDDVDKCQYKAMFQELLEAEQKINIGECCFQRLFAGKRTMEGLYSKEHPYVYVHNFAKKDVESLNRLKQKEEDRDYNRECKSMREEFQLLAQYVSGTGYYLYTKLKQDSLRGLPLAGFLKAGFRSKNKGIKAYLDDFIGGMARVLMNVASHLDTDRLKSWGIKRLATQNKELAGVLCIPQVKAYVQRIVDKAKHRKKDDRGWIEKQYIAYAPAMWSLVDTLKKELKKK